MLQPVLALVGALILGAPAPDEAAPADRTAALSVVGQRLALVVSGSVYDDAREWPRLPNAPTDASAVGDELAARYGFVVTTLADPTVEAFKEALTTLSRRAGPADDVLVFFAGHGYVDPDDHVGSFVLRDASPRCTAGCYPFDNVKRALYETQARHVLVMADACYAGFFDVRSALESLELRGLPAAGRASLKERLRGYSRYTSRLFLASVKSGPTPDGAPGTHTPFVSTLLATLGAPGPNGVVSLDALYVAMTDDAGLEVSRPVAFPSREPHNPNGTFLFIEDVPFCEAVRALADAAPGGFAAVAGGEERRDAWASTRSARWTVPGTRRCDVWHWAAGGADEVRCVVGPYDEVMGPERAAELFTRVRGCFSADEAVPSDVARERGGATYRDWRLALPSGRAVEVATVCDAGCELSLVIR
ncbi:MAG: caspase family protein [Myxococcales bacterium]|nr:caspase family protein [Myxococcales bacterium]MCB9735854.1 caspase family protein [Deltaproteobacteria bacterium]